MPAMPPSGSACARQATPWPSQFPRARQTARSKGASVRTRASSPGRASGASYPGRELKPGSYWDWPFCDDQGSAKPETATRAVAQAQEQELAAGLPTWQGQSLAERVTQLRALLGRLQTAAAYVDKVQPPACAALPPGAAGATAGGAARAAARPPVRPQATLPAPPSQLDLIFQEDSVRRFFNGTRCGRCRRC